MFTTLFLFTFLISMFTHVSPTLAAPNPSCVSKLAQFGAYSRCESVSGTSYSLYTYRCANGANKSINLNKCYEYNDIYQQATTFCQDTCATPRSSPTPLPTTPTPSPTPLGSTSFSCKVRAFRLYPADTGTNPMQYATADREIINGSTSVNPGDRFAYLIEATSKDNDAFLATISAMSTNLHGNDEPIVISGTTSNCKIENQKKNISCSQPNVKINANQPTILNIGMIFTIQPEISKTINTSTLFRPYFILPGNISYTTENGCAYMLVRSSTNPTPTPKPTSIPTTTPLPPKCVSKVSEIGYAGIEECSSQQALKADYTCKDGFSGSVGDGQTCRATTELDALAKSMCSSPHSCTVIVSSPNPTPVPTCVPRPSCKPGLKCLLDTYLSGVSYCPPSTPTPTPEQTPSPSMMPSGCYYKKVACFREPCEPVVVCPTPKPTPTPIICRMRCAVQKAGTAKDLCINNCRTKYYAK